MNLKIDQIRKLLQEQNYLFDQSIDPQCVKAGKKYWFVCDSGHIFESLISNVFQSGKFGCPICHGRRVLIGFNDMWTTNPTLASRLKNPDDGYKYTSHSNVKLWWSCPDCKNEECISPNRIATRKCLCNICECDTSYPEKFIMNLLDQCCLYFEKEKTFDWAVDKRHKKYDFYIPTYNCIVEVHGKQHYSNSDFSYLGGRTYLEEKYNDEQKMFYAKEYGDISSYIVVDCRKSEPQWIKRSIIQSGLLDVLQVFQDSIDWDECDSFATNNLSKSICEKYESGEKDIKELCKIFHLSKSSIREKLKHGTNLGWCSYDPNDIKKQRAKTNGERVVKTMSRAVVQIDMDGNDIAEFPSSTKDAWRFSCLGLHCWKKKKRWRI